MKCPTTQCDPENSGSAYFQNSTTVIVTQQASVTGMITQVLLAFGPRIGQNWILCSKCKLSLSNVHADIYLMIFISLLVFVSFPLL